MALIDVYMFYHLFQLRIPSYLYLNMRHLVPKFNHVVYIAICRKYYMKGMFSWT
jgi:hypothetical protein